MRALVMIMTIILPAMVVNAQNIKQWTLQECISYAQLHNVEVKLAELSANTTQVELSKAKWAYAPEVYLSDGYTFSSGRVLDQTTYQFVENQYVNGNNTSVGASMTLFSGMVNMHTLKRTKLDLRSSTLNIDKARNDIRLNVTAYYLEILCAQENIRNAEQMVNTLLIQEKKTEKLVQAKKVTSVDLLQIRSELANANNDLLSAHNICDIAKLNMCQLLEIPDYKDFNTVTPPQEEMSNSISGLSPDKVLEAAQSLPELEVARSAINIARSNLSISRSAYYPNISLSLGYGSSYSDARYKALQNPDGTYRYEAYPFFQQYTDNANAFISIGINIPIFRKLEIRNNVKLSKFAILQSNYNLLKIEKQINKQVQQAFIDSNTAWEKYLSSQQYVASANEAARQVELKYELGSATVVEYNTVLNTLVQAKTQLLKAKYEYIFKTEIIKFYISQREE